MNTKAWSTLRIKSVDTERRIVEGIASTPSTDRMNDTVDPMGAEFSLPLPFLWQHDAERPVGHVVHAAPTRDGIPVRIRIASIEEPGTLRDRVEEAWLSLKSGLVRGLSIGFAPLEYERNDDGGFHFSKWNWLELSGVTIPANAQASVTAIKAAYAAAQRKAERPTALRTSLGGSIFKALRDDRPPEPRGTIGNRRNLS